MKKIIMTVTLLLLLAIGSGCQQRDVAPPLILLNDVMYKMYDDRPSIEQDLIENWAYVGKVESCVGLSEIPKKNFQANTRIVGAELYHSNEGRIIIRNYSGAALVSVGEFFGDCIIVAFEGQYYQYIALAEFGKVDELMRISADDGKLLLVNGVIYRLGMMKSRDDFQLDDTYIYLGRIASKVSAYVHPTENFQSNSPFISVGSEIYEMPQSDDAYADILVIDSDSDSDFLYYYSMLKNDN